jgi:hypothetical protein
MRSQDPTTVGLCLATNQPEHDVMRLHPPAAGMANVSKIPQLNGGTLLVFQ